MTGARGTPATRRRQSGIALILVLWVVALMILFAAAFSFSARGEVRLANFNPSKGTEAGKIRPCLVIQSNLLNNVDHPSTTVIPLTSQIVADAAPLRLPLPARDLLKTDSDLMIDQIRTIDNRRLSGEPLTVLTRRELAEVEEYLKLTLGLEPL